MSTSVGEQNPSSSPVRDQRYADKLRFRRLAHFVFQRNPFFGQVTVALRPRNCALLKLATEVCSLPHYPALSNRSFNESITLRRRNGLNNGHCIIVQCDVDLPAHGESLSVLPGPVYTGGVCRPGRCENGTSQRSFQDGFGPLWCWGARPQHQRGRPCPGMIRATSCAWWDRPSSTSPDHTRPGWE